MKMSSYAVAPLLHHVRDRGGDIQPLMNRFNLPPDAPERSSVSLTTDQFGALFDAAAEVAADPFIGINVALALPRGRYGIVEFCILSSQDLGDAIDRFTRYASLLRQPFFYELQRGPTSSITHKVRDGARLGRHANEYIVAAMVIVIARVTGQPMPIERLWFSHPKPADTSLLQQMFGTDQLTFNAPDNGFSFNGAWLQMPLISADPALLSVMEQAANLQLQTVPAPEEDFVVQVQQQISDLLRGRAPTAQDVARKMAVSVRTLQRRLTECGATFQDALDAVRQETATRQLRGGRATVDEVAFLLGYADARSFARAFRRWTGTTPVHFRKSGADGAVSAPG